MLRYLAGVASALLLVAAGIVIWRSQASAVQLVPNAPTLANQPVSFADVTAPPEAGEKTREEKRFSRYDKDKNGGVNRAEYLTARNKNFLKLDVDRDGKLSFSEYAVKALVKFQTADRDRTGVLTPVEFLTTKVVRNSSAVKCPRPSRLPVAPAEAPVEESADDAPG